MAALGYRGARKSGIGRSRRSLRSETQHRLIRVGPLARRLGLFLRKLMKDMSPDPGGGLPAAVRKDHDSKLVLWDKSDIGRRVVQAAILVDDREVSSFDDLPREALGEARINGEDALLGERHRRLQRTLVGELAEIGGQEHGHVAR